MYGAIGIFVVVLAVIGLVTYSGNKRSEEATAKAQQLTKELESQGLRAPDEDILVRTLGTDGGNVCDNPASALGRATLNDQLTNGADFVGRRVIIIDERMLRGEAAILRTYCPDELAKYRDKIQDFKTDDTLKD
jgi:hypothetical protein